MGPRFVADGIQRCNTGTVALAYAALSDNYLRRQGRLERVQDENADLPAVIHRAKERTERRH